MSVQKKEKDTRVGGIAMCIVAFFMLLFLIFGGAFIGGAAIRSFFIGLFGFAAYAYAAGLLILGILRIKRVRATARVARILLFSGIIALALLLLHQISTNAVFKGQSYGGYLGRCYNGMSVGGVLFGLIAYPVHFILGGVVSYIVYVLGLIALLLFAFRILPPGARAGAEGPPEVRPRQHFARDRVGARAVYENENRLLFNMELTGSHAPAQQGTASSMPEGARVTSAAEPPLTAFSDLHRGVPLTSDAAAPQQPSAPQGGSRAAYDALMGSQSPFANGNQPAGQVLAPPPSSALYPSSPAPTGYGGGASYGGGSYAPPPQQQQTAYANPYPPAAPVAYVSPYQTASAGGAGGLPNPFSAGAYGGEIPPVFDPSQSPIVGVRTSRRPSMVVHDTTQKPAPAAARQEQTAVNNMARFIDGDARSRELNVNKKPGEAAARSNVSATLAPDLRSRIMDGDAMSNALRTGRPGTVGTAAVKPQALQQTQPQQRSNIGNFAALKAAAEEIHAASKEGRDPDPRILAAAESAPLKPNQQPPIVPVASPADLLQKPPDAAMISAPKEPKPLPAADIAPAQSRLFGAPKPAPAAPTPPPQDTKPAYTLEDSGKVEPFVPLKPEKMMPDDPGDPQPRQAADLPFATSAREDANAIIDDKSLAAAFKPVAPKPKGVLPGQMDITEYVTDEEERAKPVKVYPDYNPPPIDLLAQSDTFSSVIGDEETDKARLLEECLANFKCPGHVVAIVKGPAVTRYEYKLDPGINVNAVARVKDTIAYNLQTTGNVHVEAPIPGKQAIGIEVPNDKVGIVSLRSVIDSDKFYASTKPLTYALGKDIAGEIIISNLPALVHLLVAGTTGSGKSSGLNCVLVSLVYKYSPEDMRLVLIDPKKVEFVNYNGMPHLLIEKAIVDTQAAIRALNWAADEVDRRFTLFNKARVRNIDEYNRLDDVVAKKRNKLPYIVCVVDELAQLIDDNKQEVEACLRRLTALARAAGVHLIIATQRPSTEVINGVIKANVPSVMAFATKSDIDSRVITGENGCEDLLGRGDMLFYPQGAPSATRVQGAYVDTAEVNAVVEYLIANNEADFDPEIERLVNTEPKSFASEDEDDEDDGPREFVPDKLFMEALRLFIDKNDASITMIQRRFGVGYNKAARVIDQMEQMNLISEKDQTNKRKVLITLEDYLTRFGDYL